MSEGPGVVERLRALDSPTFTIDRGIVLVGASGEVNDPIKRASTPVQHARSQ